MINVPINGKKTYPFQKIEYQKIFVKIVFYVIY